MVIQLLGITTEMKKLPHIVNVKRMCRMCMCLNEGRRVDLEQSTESFLAIPPFSEIVKVYLLFNFRFKIKGVNFETLLQSNWRKLNENILLRRV